MAIPNVEPTRLDTNLFLFLVFTFLGEEAVNVLMDLAAAAPGLPRIDTIVAANDFFWGFC